MRAVVLTINRTAERHIEVSTFDKQKRQHEFQNSKKGVIANSPAQCEMKAKLKNLIAWQI
jgi:hypothetical protein